MGEMNRVGMIGGTGLYSIDGMEVLETKKVETPFGSPSSELTVGRLGKSEVVFLPRHGKHHEILPSEINFRANIWALKSLGVRQVISVSATGSLVKEIAPGQIAIPNQYFDWTKGKRVPSFFGAGMVGHISTAEVACPKLTAALVRAGEKADVSVQTEKTYACVEGPRLGTRAESFFLKGAGCDLVGMTNVPESFLAKEAQLAYVTIAIATDYDCWLDDPAEHVTVEQVIARYQKTLGKVRALLEAYFEDRDPLADVAYPKSLEGAVLTAPDRLTGQQKEILEFLQI